MNTKICWRNSQAGTASETEVQDAVKMKAKVGCEDVNWTERIQNWLCCGDSSERLCYKQQGIT